MVLQIAMSVKGQKYLVLSTSQVGGYLGNHGTISTVAS